MVESILIHFLALGAMGYLGWHVLDVRRRRPGRDCANCESCPTTPKIPPQQLELRVGGKPTSTMAMWLDKKDKT